MKKNNKGSHLRIDGLDDNAKSLTAEQYRRLTHDYPISEKIRRPITNTNKYRNTRVEYDGLKFDSKKELKRYLVLRKMLDDGEIHCLERQVPFMLIPKNEHFRGIYYRADFTYRDRFDTLIVEDVKGFKTREYELKKKLMYHFHKIKISEV